MNSLSLHGSIRFLGTNDEVQNLGLERLEIDPIDPSPNRIWFNTTENRVKYSEQPLGFGPVGIRHISTDQDLHDIITTLSLKASLNDVNDINTILVTNVSNSDMFLGQPVYGIAGLNVDLAIASNSNRKNVIGLVSNNLILSQTGAGRIKSSGVLVGSVQQWEYSTGMVGGLVPKMNYFLDIVQGKFSPFPPTDSGSFNCMLGMALTTTEFLIRIERTITL